MPHTKTIVSRFLVSTLLVSLMLPAWADDKAKDEETIRNAATVLQAMRADKSIPPGVVGKANCIIVLPSVKKFAVGIGGSGGRGPMICRTNGKWSAPAMFTIGGASAGL